MKTKFFVLALVTVLSTTSQAQDLFGFYKKTHVVDHSQVGQDEPNPQYRQYSSEEECQNDSGNWVEGETGFVCRLQAQDDVSVLRSEVSDAFVKIKKSAIGGHVCSYEATARQVSKNMMVSESEGCRITLNFSGNRVSVSATNSCYIFCGAALDLNISGATK